ncbi:hypothetical protein [Siccirubricoccus deserti]|nr:hypothetical protein [Siccirubricoccus deserti]
MARLQDLGFQMAGGTPAEFAAFQRGEINLCRQVVRTAGITAD